MNPHDQDIPLPKIATRDEWLDARKALLAREKELTHQRDALNRARRELPMVEIEKDYVFEGPEGRVTLHDLFEGRRQLIIYHFMLDPDHDEGCVGCSFLADNLPRLEHLHARRTTLAMVSRAPWKKIVPFRDRMGWTVPWYSSCGSDFNYDFHVTIDRERGSTEWNYTDILQSWSDAPKDYKGELPGISVFVRDGRRIFHSYSTYARGLEMVLPTSHFLDLTPFGRGEGWDGMPDLDGKGLNWVEYHDRYAADETAAPDVAAERSA